MKKLKENQPPDPKIKFRPNASPAPLTSFRSWIPSEEFCELYRLPKYRPARRQEPKFSTSKQTACRKCCERLAAKGLIVTRKIDGHLYVSRQSAISFGETA